MQMIPSTSSQIASFGHDADTNTLHVNFRSGGNYTYTGVDAAKFERMKAAPSPGSFFHSEIKPNHEWAKKK